MSTRPHAMSMLALAAANGSSAAMAADNTRYLSTSGSNANACALAAPCRTLQRGIKRTPPGGELRILDSGDYCNNASITKSLTVSSNGHTVYLGASPTVSSPGAVVAIRRLVLNGQSAITHGISVDEVAGEAVVNIERSVISAFTQTGIRVASNGRGAAYIKGSAS